MKKLVLIILAVSNFAWGSPPVEQDKILHFTVSYGLSYTCANVTHEPWPCALGTLFLGVAKELYVDRGSLDSGDILANSLGIGMSLVVLEF